MLRSKLFVYFLAVYLMVNLAPVLNIKEVQAVTVNVPVPVVTKFVQYGQYTDQPLIQGNSVPGEEVMVYLDGSFNGFAPLAKVSWDQYFFSYRITSSLEIGTHTLMVIGKDQTSLVLSAPSKEIEFKIKPIPAPFIISPNNGTVFGQDNILITGLAVSGTFVSIYIDDTHIGKTPRLVDNSGTANFYFRPQPNLSPGIHTIWAVSTSDSGRLSEFSRVIRFKTEAALPTPTILKTQLLNSKNFNIVGLTKNDTRIKIYVDKKLQNEIKPQNNKSGTANFSYRANLDLTNGQHLIYTTAIDAHGKESRWSNPTYFLINKKNPVISQVGVSEKNPVLEPKQIEKPKTAKPAERPKKVTKPAPTPTPTKKPATQNNEPGSQVNPEIQNLLDNGAATTTPQSGLINEKKVGQNKFQLNLIIFIIFLLGVIAWIFWVNRELIRERREQDKEDKKDDDQLDLKL